MPTRPDLMVIGDSLAQGCRSLSVSKDRCAQSYGARIAAANQWAFRPPDHPWPVVFDLEKIIRRGTPMPEPLSIVLSIAWISEAMKSNVRKWQDAVEKRTKLSQQDTFENLGIAGARIQDLFDRSYETSRNEFDGILSGGALTGPLTRFFSSVGDLHIAINSCFTLNPRQEQAHDKKTPLDWVEERKPRRLIVQIGHNHGLFSIGFLGEDRYVTMKSLPGIRELAKRLAKLPPEIEEIYYFLLPKVSAVANLEPRGAVVDGYAEEYRPVFAPSTNRLSGNRLREIDESIRETNEELKDCLNAAFQKYSGGSARLTFVNAYNLFDRYDFKNSENPSALIQVPGRSPANNNRLDGVFPVIHTPKKTIKKPGKLVNGGFQSADGMHPSGLGYAVLAEELHGLMGLPALPPSARETAYQEDTLLSRFPIQYEWLCQEINILQNLLHALSAGTATLKKTQQDMVDLLDSLGAVMRCR
jgi:hypothetical protein